MEVEHLQEFASRNRELVDRLKSQYWVEQKKVSSPLDALRIADGLRVEAVTIKPGWPGQAERAADLRFHQELAERLRAVGTSSRR